MQLPQILLSWMTTTMKSGLLSEEAANKMGITPASSDESLHLLRQRSSIWTSPFPDDAWTLLLYQSNCKSEGETFLTLLNASLVGQREECDRIPKGMRVTADQVIGSWRPALQLGIFKIVKDCVSAAINFKYALCQVVPSWQSVLQEETEDAMEERLRKEMEESARTGIFKGIDYSRDPMIQLLHNKSNFVASFRRWYSHVRARYLPEPFMFVSLSATNLLFDASSESSRDPRVCHPPVLLLLRIRSAPILLQWSRN